MKRVAEQLEQLLTTIATVGVWWKLLGIVSREETQQSGWIHDGDAGRWQPVYREWWLAVKSIGSAP